MTRPLVRRKGIDAFRSLRQKERGALGSAGRKAPGQTNLKDRREGENHE